MEQTDKFQSFLDRLAHLLESGEIEQLAQYFAEPLPIYMDGQLVFEATAARVPDLIFRMRAEAVRKGMKSVSVKLKTLEPDRSIGQPLVAIWVFADHTGREIARSNVRYLCTPRDGAHRIETVEYLQAAFPQYLDTLAETKIRN